MHKHPQAECVAFNNKLFEWLGENNDAISLCSSMVTVIHVWDDLYDMDNEVDDKTLNDTFLALMITIPRNNFYKQFFSDLNPVLLSCYLNWEAANQIEKSADKKNLIKAYTLRASVLTFISYCIMLARGLDFYRSIAKDIWSYYNEDFEKYLIEFKGGI